MATQNTKKILGLGFRFYGPKYNKNKIKPHRRNSHMKNKNYRRSQIRATYNSMFYGH